MRYEIELSSEDRLNADLGKGVTQRLRKEQGKIPGVILGDKEEPKLIQLEKTEVDKVQDKKEFYEQGVALRNAGYVEIVTVHTVARHPVDSTIVHIEFKRVV